MSISFWDNFDSAKNCHATYTHHKRFLGHCLWWKQNVSGLDLQNGSSIIMYCCEKLGCNLANILPDKKYFKRSLHFWTKTYVSNFLVQLKVIKRKLINWMALKCKYQAIHFSFDNVLDIYKKVHSDWILSLQIVFRTDLFLLNIILAKRTFVQCSRYLTSHELILFRQIYLIYTIMSQG